MTKRKCFRLLAIVVATIMSLQTAQVSFAKKQKKTKRTKRTVAPLVWAPSQFQTIPTISNPGTLTTAPDVRHNQSASEALGKGQKRGTPPAPIDARSEIKEPVNQAPAPESGNLSRPTPRATSAEGEPNDTSGTATALTFTPTAITTGAINPGGDIDFYTFTAPAGSKVWIETDTGGVQNAGATSRDTVIDYLQPTAQPLSRMTMTMAPATEVTAQTKRA